ESGRASLDGAGVDANGFDPVEVKRGSAVGMKRPIHELGNGRGTGNRMDRSDGRAVAIDDFKARRLARRGHERTPVETEERRIAPEARRGERATAIGAVLGADIKDKRSPIKGAAVVAGGVEKGKLGIAKS